jgi:hypothetical protein
MKGSAMDHPGEDETGYRRDQGHEGSATPPTREWQRSADRNPDDFGPEAEHDSEVNPDTGADYGTIDSGRAD